MELFFYISLVLGIISLIMFLVFRKPKVTLKALFSKSVTSILFIITAVTAFYANENCPDSLALLFIIAGVFGLMGDVWLDAKYLTKEYEAGFLKAGFSFFLVGHIFYSTAMLLNFDITVFHLICGGIGVFIGLIACPFTEKFMKANFGKSKLISIVYTAILGLTAGIAGAVMISGGFKFDAILRFAAMVLFFLSDAVLAKIYFCENQATKFNITLNHLFYYAAQFLLSASLFVS